MQVTTRNLDSTEVSAPAHGGPGVHSCRGVFVVDGAFAHLINFGPFSFKNVERAELREIWTGLIGSLSGLQSEKVRFRVRINPWLWCSDYDLISPWEVRGGMPRSASFNGEYLQLLTEFVGIASEGGVQVEVVLFDGEAFIPGRKGTGYFRNPFNPRFGGLLGPSPRPSFFQVSAPTNFEVRDDIDSDWPNMSLHLQLIQHGWVNAFVKAAGGFANVQWMLYQNLDGVDPVRIAFIEHFIEFLRVVDPLDRAISCTTRTPGPADSALYRTFGIDTVQSSVAQDGFGVNMEIADGLHELREFGKPVVLESATSGWDIRNAWLAVIGGGSPTFPFGPELTDPVFLAFVKTLKDIGTRLLSSRARIWDDAQPDSQTIWRSGGDQVIGYTLRNTTQTGEPCGIRIKPGKWLGRFVNVRTGDSQDLSVTSNGVASIEMDYQVSEAAFYLIRSRE
ncbi:MAG: hypothetical protein ABJA67_03190 [Chthonomonadales bacterium]